MNEILSNSFQISIRTVGAFAVLFLLARWMGSRSLAQMTYFDYIMGITIGSIAAVMAVDDSLPFYYPLLAMVLFALLIVIFSYITTKSLPLRRFFSGTPSIVIYKGKIIEKNLRKCRIDLNELLSECRKKGFFNADDIAYAVMESNGELSVLPKSDKRPMTPQDNALSPQQEPITANLILDGKVMTKNLKAIGKEENWLKKQLSDHKVSDVKDVLLATGDMDGNFQVYLTEESPGDLDCFI